MLYEIKGVCHYCAAEYKLIISEDQTHGICPECKNIPIKFKKFKGVVYIIKNPNQIGVKVGITKRNIDDRIKQLSGTGVPGKFKLVALFPSDRPEEDEKKAHEKLKKHFLDKEHFDISAIDALMSVYRALNRRHPIFYDSEIQKEFEIKCQENKEEMFKKLGKI
jgi:hypothetical protein